VAIGQTAEHDDAILDFRDQVLRPSERANLLTREGGRYDLEPSVRAYLERRRPPETTEWRRYCLSHAEAHLVVIADYDAAIREGRMTYSAPLEWSNVAAAVDRLAELMPTDDAAARVLVAYAQHWSTVLFNNYDPRRVAWLEAADAAAERVGSALERANVLQAMGDVQRFRKEMEAALVSYQQALTLYQAAGSRLGEANVLVAKGQLTLINADQAAADRLLEQALAIYRTIGDRYSVPAQIGNYGWTLWRIGRHEQARPYLLQAADLFAEMGLVDYAERYRSAAEGSAHADNGQEDQP